MMRRRRSSRREPTIALINVVFLMLVFFMVAGTLAAPMDKTLSLVRTSDLDGRTPPNALVIHADGALSYRGDPVASVAEFHALSQNDDPDGPARIVPDRDLDAAQLVTLAAELRAAGAERVMIVTERALQ